MRGKGRKYVSLFLAVSMLTSSIQPVVYAEEGAIVGEGNVSSNSNGSISDDDILDSIQDLQDDGLEVIIEQDFDSSADSAGSDLGSGGDDFLLDATVLNDEGTGENGSTEGTGSSSDTGTGQSEPTDGTDTCTHTYENGVCTLCGTVCSHETVVGDSDSGEITVSAFENGVCSICGLACTHETTETVSKPATCTEDGYENAKICTLCGMITNTDTYTVLPAAHQFEDGVCTVCGITEHHYNSEGFCTDEGCTMIYQPAVLNVNGQYEIGNAGQLYWFAQKVNGTASDTGDESTSGDGTSENTSENTSEIGETVSTAYDAVLTGDIVFDPNSSYPEWNMIGDGQNIFYNGVFDGGSHSIKNLSIQKENNPAALFGRNAGTIKNLNLENISFSGPVAVGICGMNTGTIEGCDVSGSIDAMQIATGICYVNNGSVQDCDISGSIDATEMASGICYKNDGLVQSCNVAAIPTAENTEDGTSLSTIITSDGNVGGICYDNLGTLENCTVNGSIDAEYAGGICIYNEGILKECTTNGSISADYASGIADRIEDYEDTEIQILSCTNNAVITATHRAAGICREIYGGEYTSITLEKCQNKGSITISTVDSYTTASAVGGVAGSAEGCVLLKGCSNAGDILINNTTDINRIGGVCGYLSNGRMVDCTNTGNIGGGEDTGGVCGYLSNGQMMGCTNTGSVYGTHNVGGVCGCAEENAQLPSALNEDTEATTSTDTIQNCTNSGSVTGTVEKIGGICGSCYGTISGCVNAADAVISCENDGYYIAGIVGYLCNYNDNFVVKDCENQGTVIGNDGVGGIVSYIDCNKVSFLDCKNSGTVSGKRAVGGITPGDSSSGAPCALSLSDEDSSDVSYNQAILYKRCTNSGTVQGDCYVGGITGSGIDYAAFLDCENSGTVTGGPDSSSSDDGSNSSDSNGEYIGGIVGYSTYQNYFGNCINSGSVTGNPNSESYGGDYIGGIAGYVCSENYFEDCVNSGSVRGVNGVGGINGLSENKSSFVNCQNAESGIVENLLTSSSNNIGNAFGGIVGLGQYCMMDGCSNLGTVSGVWDVGGIAGTLVQEIAAIDCTNSGTVTGVLKVGGIAGATDGNSGGQEQLSLSEDDNNDLADSGNKLFKRCENSGTVRGGENVGGIIGSSAYCTFIECKNTASVSGIYQTVPTDDGEFMNLSAMNIGGIIGYSTEYEYFESCVNSGTVCAAGEAGGIAGYLKNGMISQCNNTGAINGCYLYTNSDGTTAPTEVLDVGGIAGSCDAGTIEFSYNTGNICGNITPGSSEAAISIGGITGFMYSGSVIQNCYNLGDISGTTLLGGISGDGLYESQDMIASCYNAGNISVIESTAEITDFEKYCWGSLVTIPKNMLGTIENCYYLDDTAASEEENTEDSGEGSTGGSTGGNTGESTENSDESSTGENGTGVSGITAMTGESFASGEVAFLLNEGQSSSEQPQTVMALSDQQPSNIVWYQTIGTDATPVLDSSHGIVYEVYDFEAECHPTENYTIAYSNVDKNTEIFGNVELRDAKDVTCTEDGYTGDYYCKVCDTLLEEGTVIYATGHKEEVQNAVEATCTEDGNTGSTVCSVCGEVLVEGEVITALGHKPELQNAKEATCQEAGYTGDSVCTVCGEVLETGTVIPMSEDHNFDENGECTWCHLIKGTCGDLEWFLTVDGVLTIQGEGVIPDFTSASAAPWYTNRAKITSVIIEAGVTGIGNNAFNSYSNISSIRIADSVQKIGDYSFFQCTSLTEVSIPGSVQSIGRSAFSCDYSLAGITIAEGVQSIGSLAFYKCAFTEVVLPDSITVVRDNAFQNCKSLEKVSLGKGITQIEPGVFSGCTSLTEFAVSEESASYQAMDGILFNKEGTVLVLSPVKKTGTYTIPEGVTEVGPYAFYQSKLTEISLPENLKTIGTYAFAESSFSDITIPGSVSTIGSYAFQNSKLVSVEIPDSVTSIGTSTFASCLSLETVKLGNGITEIPDNAFQYCNSLTKISIPTTVKTIGSSAFGSCGSLESIRIGKAVTRIYLQAFLYCTALSDVYYMGTEETWQDMSLGGGNTPLTSATFHYGTANCELFGHEMIQGRMEPTCTESGYEEAHYCAYCRYVDDSVTVGAIIPATGHTAAEAVVENEVEGDCQNVGKYDNVVYCEVCHEELSRETIDTELGDHKYTCETTAATCTEDGKNVFTCSVCGDTYTDTLPALGHNFTESERIKDPTCTETGEAVYQCSRCEETETRTLAALGHSYSSVVTKKATCTEAGIRTYTCSRCQDQYTKDIPALGHSYGKTVITSPTCTERGENSYTCSRCDHTYTETVPALGHSYTKTITATCTEPGITTYTCTREGCTQSYTEETAALGHRYTSQITTEATCTEDGVRTYTCSACGDSFTKVIPAKGHRYTTQTTATCTQAGETMYTCSVCGDTYTEETEALGHDYRGTVTVEATCTEKGVKTYTCTRCDESYTKEIPAKGHAHKLILSTATCTQNGKEIYECSKCGDREYKEAAALGHNFAVETTVTCTEDGIETGTCSRCGYTYSKNVKATGHAYEIEAVLTPATCTTDGEAVYTCANCGDSYVGKTAAKGHKYACTVIQEATCTSDGEGIYTCVNCGYSYREVIPSTGHHYSYTVTEEPTCTEAGEYRYTCYGCGDTYTREVSPLGHSYVRKVTEEPTCTEGGKATYICCRCDESYEADIPAIGHIYRQDAVVTPPTCTEDGSASYHCVLCDDTKSDIMPATGHSFVGERTKEPTCDVAGTMTYTCSNCGETYEQDITPLGHQFTEEITTEPTCTEKGVKTYTCTREGCTKIFEAEIPATGHDYECEVIKEPTCTEEGTGTYTCKNCSDSKQDIIEALGHDYEEKIVTAATCTKAGLAKYTCSRCDDSYTKAIPAKGHSYDCETVPATCTQAGSNTYTCKNQGCNATYTTKIAALGHDYVETITKEATCTEPGEKTFTCSRCGDTYVEVIPDGHQYMEVCTATCTEDGYTTYTCELCGYEYSEYTIALGHEVILDEEIPATCSSRGLTEGSHCARCGEVLKEQEVVTYGSHAWLEHHVLTPATCLTEGVQYGICRYCGMVAEEAIPVLNHPSKYRTSKKENYTEATETADGSYDQVVYCRLCNQEISRKTYILHNMVQDKMIQEGTCEKTGICRYKCTNCDRTETKYVYGSHDWIQSEVTKDPTCTEEGEVKERCKICGKTRTRTLGMLKHSYKYEELEGEDYHRAVCTTCGYETTGGHVMVNGACMYCGKQETTTYQIEVYINGILDNTITAKKGQFITVKADKTYRNMNFSCWADDPEGLSVRSYSKNYTFYASKDESVYAVYTTTSVKPEPVLTLADIHSHSDDENNYVYFGFNRDVPDGYTMLEHGILYGGNASVFGAPDADVNELLMFADSDFSAVKDKVFKLPVTTNNNRIGTDFLDAPIGNNLNGLVYARGYVIVVDDETDEKLAFLSSVSSASFNSAIDLNSKKCVITVVYNDGLEREVIETTFGSTITLSTKGYEFANREFAYWSKDPEGQSILSYRQNYNYSVAGEETIYAVYSVVLEPAPSIAVGSVKSYTSGDKNYIRFMFNRDVPSGYSMLEHGILYGGNASVFGAEGADVNELLQFDDFTKSTLKEKVFKLEVTSNASKVGTDYLDASVGTRKDGIVYARGYVIVLNENTGEKELYYSSVISGSFNSFLE